MTDGLYIGVDPGKTTGVAYMHVNNGLLAKYEKAEYSVEMLYIIAQGFQNNPGAIKAFIVEDFLLFAHKAQAQVGSRFEAVEIKAIIKYVAYMTNITCILQSQEKKDIGNTYSGIWKGGKKSHMPNGLSAYNHAFYYLVENNIIPHPVLLDDDDDDWMKL